MSSFIDSYLFGVRVAGAHILNDNIITFNLVSKTYSLFLTYIFLKKSKGVKENLKNSAKIIQVKNSLV